MAANEDLNGAKRGIAIALMRCDRRVEPSYGTSNPFGKLRASYSKTYGYRAKTRIGDARIQKILHRRKIYGVEEAEKMPSGTS
jgi:hypothetical protein